LPNVTQAVNPRNQRKPGHLRFSARTKRSLSLRPSLTRAAKHYSLRFGRLGDHEILSFWCLSATCVHQFCRSASYDEPPSESRRFWRQQMRRSCRLSAQGTRLRAGPVGIKRRQERANLPAARFGGRFSTHNRDAHTLVTQLPFASEVADRRSAGSAHHGQPSRGSRTRAFG